jgi:hypothetical protein
VLNVFSHGVGTLGPRKNSGSHIDASLSRQPLVKGERLVRYEVNAVMHCFIQRLISKLITCLSWRSPQVGEAGRVARIFPARQNRNVANTIAVPVLSIALKDGERASYLLGLLAMIKCSICSYQCDN